MAKFVLYGKEVEEMLDTVISRITSRDLITVLSEYAKEGMIENFDNQKDSAGSSWQPLSEKRIKERIRKRTWPGQILVEHGLLSDIKYNVISNLESEVGTTAKYGNKHNRKGGHIPKRQWLYLSKETQQKMLDEMIKYLGDDKWE